MTTPSRGLCGALLAATLGSAPLGAAELPQLRFLHHDWELACDNTRTCRAAGYHAEEGENAPVSVLLTRQAGPGTRIDARLRLGGDERAVPARLAMFVDDRSLGQVTLHGDEALGMLSRAQADALLRAVAGSGVVAWRAEGRSWTLSGKGAAAVLLKMDDFQGRIDTPDAAIRKGTRPERGALPALPALQVVAAPVPPGALPRPDKAQERTLLATLRKSAGAEDCADLAAIATGEAQFAYAPLTPSKMLVSARCWRGAYNEGHGYWVVNRAAPFAPQAVTASGTDYEDGAIGAAHKGRGIGDCWGHDEWVWDGRRFVHAKSATTGMCRAIAAGGAWDLPTLVTTVVRRPVR